MSTAVDIKSMFDSIKDSLNIEKPGNASYRNYLKTEVGKTYLVRLIPNIKEPKATFFHYQHHGFTSLSTGQYVDATCPRTYGERCPMCETRFKLYKTKKEEDRNLAYTIRALEKHLVNVYVINDPSNAENEGTIKILRFGKRIYDKFLGATEGDDADEFGSRIYDLTENGCNFKIKVETASENNCKFTNYNNSRFTAPGAIANMTSEKISEIYNNIFDLSKILDTKTEAEINSMLKEHVFCQGVKVDKDDANKSGNIEDSEPASDPDPDPDPEPETEGKKKQTDEKAKAPKSENSKQDEKIKNLLSGLDSL